MKRDTKPVQPQQNTLEPSPGRSLSGYPVRPQTSICNGESNPPEQRLRRGRSAGAGNTQSLYQQRKLRRLMVGPAPVNHTQVRGSPQEDLHSIAIAAPRCQG